MKKYQKRVLVGNSLYEAEMFYIPYFELEKNKLKCIIPNVPKRFQWLKNLCDLNLVTYELNQYFPQGAYYTWFIPKDVEEFKEQARTGIIKGYEHNMFYYRKNIFEMEEKELERWYYQKGHIKKENSK